MPNVTSAAAAAVLAASLAGPAWAQAQLDMGFSYEGEVARAACLPHGQSYMDLRNVCLVFVGNGEGQILGYGVSEAEMRSYAEDGPLAEPPLNLIVVVFGDLGPFDTGAAPAFAVDGEALPAWDGPKLIEGGKVWVIDERHGHGIDPIADALRTGATAEVTLTRESGETVLLTFPLADVGAAMDALDASVE